MSRMQTDKPSTPLHDQILDVLRKSPSSADEKLTALLHCTAHIRNRINIEQTVKECGLSLTGFLVNNDLEFYYDLKHGRHDVVYISKGWDDPGVRIGDIVEVSKSNAPYFKANAIDFKANIFALLKFCSTQGVCISFEEKDEVVEIQMDSVIYSEGFNKKVFEQVVEGIVNCVKKANELMTSNKKDGVLDDEDKYEDDEAIYNDEGVEIDENGRQIVNIDENPEDADWTKRSWDLPPYGSDEFNAYLKGSGMTLEAFKRLPVYKWAVERGDIKE